MTRELRPHLHAQRFEIAHRARGQLVVERWQDARTRLDQDHARLPRIDAAEIARQRVAAHLADRTGQLHAGRAAADDDEREMATTRLDALIALRGLERFEHATADLGGLRQRLQSGRVRLPFFVTEVRVLRAAGEQQVVVWILAARR